jgi:hypothetical protein
MEFHEREEGGGFGNFLVLGFGLGVINIID